MSVLNGQLANQTTFNNAFMSRTAATTSTVAIVALNNGTGPSGASIANTQEAINETFDAVGMTGILDTTRNDYATNNVVTNGEDRKEAIGALDAAFDDTTGHAHDGSAGGGAPISAPDLADYNDYWTEFQSFDFTGAAGTDDDVSIPLAGKVSGGNAVTEGVLTSNPDNMVYIVDSSTGTFLEDAEGQRIYARLTESVGVWTLTYYTNEAGTETAASISPATDIKALYREVFTSANRPTIPSSPADFGTLDVTAEIADANTNVAGKLAVGAQNIPTGVKTFTDTTESTDKDTGSVILEGGIGIEKRINAGGRIAGAGLDSTAGLNVSGGAWRGSEVDDSSSTGASASIASPTTLRLSVSNASLTSVAKFSTPVNNQLFIFTNKTGADIDIINADSAADDILTGTGADLTLADMASLWFCYDTAATRWRVVGGSGSGGGSTSAIAPSVQKFLSGSGTYTTPAGVSYIKVQVVGGGSGGNSSATVDGAAGNASTFGTSLITGGGASAPSGTNGGTGGVGSVTGSATVLQTAAVDGGSGQGYFLNQASGATSPHGGQGGDSFFGGGGGGGGQGSAGVNNAAGSGGGAGGYAEAIITAPLASYSYSVGAGGAGGTTGTYAGGAGGSGVIVVTEYYSNAASTGGDVPAGVVVATAASVAPAGWLPCDGAAVSRTTFAALFSAIGTLWGVGDGSTTFNVPNGGGLFLRGAGSQTLGGIGYSGTAGTYENDKMQGHLHGPGTLLRDSTARYTTDTGGPYAFGTGAANTTGPVDDGSNGTPRVGAETNPANMQMLFIIKT